MFYVVIEQLEKWTNLSLAETKRELMEVAYLPGGERERERERKAKQNKRMLIK